ncbi:MAG: hypothetical protein KTR18_01275 [Acidiferrobacterales bacterium]|nr:hypothetical protein [Acidiferrobacterales bacterium]
MKSAPIHNSTKISFVFLWLVIIVFFVAHRGQSLRIDTNLKDLSPQLTSDQGLQHAVAELSKDIESRFTLLITGTSEQTVAEVAVMVSDRLLKLPGVQADIGNSRVSAQLVDSLTPHRFGLITESHKNLITDLSKKELVNRANERLYEIADTARLLPIHQDPLGWFSDYLFQQFNATPRGDIRQPFELVRVQLSLNSLETAVQQSLQSALSEIEQQVHETYTEIDIYRSGVFFFAAEAAGEARSDIQLISAVSVLAIITLLLLTFFSLRPLLLPFVSVAMGIVFAFVITHWLYGSIHILTIVFGASLIGIIIDYSLHYFYCHSNLATENTHAGLLNAMKLSLVSSLIGYGALGLSELVSLQKIAVFSCSGLVAAWLTVLALANKLMGSSVTVNPTFLPPIVKALTNFTAPLALKHPIMIGAVVCTLMALALYGIRGNDSPRAFFNPSTALLEEEKLVAKHSSKLEPGQYFVIRAKDEESLFERVDSLTQKYPADTLVTISNWLLPPAVQRTNIRAQESLYIGGGAIELFLNDLGIEAKPLQTEFALAADKILSPLALFQDPTLSLPPLALEYHGTYYSFALIKDISEVKSNSTRWQDVPGVDFIDITSLSSQALKNQREASARFLALAFLLVAITVYIRYRSWRKLSMMLVPVGAVTSTLLLLSVFGPGITLFHAMALFLVLGLGMDYVIFVSELHNESQMTLQAVFLSALTSLLSFGLLSLSSIPVVHAFGITVLIGNGLNLAGTFIYAHLQPLPQPSLR